MRDFSGAGGGGGSSRSPTRTANNLLSQDYVEILLGLGAGPWKGLVPGTHGPLQNLFLGDTAVQNVSDGSANFADFRIAQFNGDLDDPPVERVLGGDATNLTVGVSLASNTPVVRTTSPALRKTDTFPGIDRLEVRLLFNQLVKQTDDGTFEHTALFRIEYKATNSGTWLYYETESQSSIKGKTDGMVKDFLIPVLPLTNADYEVRVTKLSPDNGTQEIVNMSWESLQMVSLAKPNYPGLAKLHLYGRISEQFSSMPEISGIYDGFLIWVPSNYNPETRTYDESTPWNGQLVKRYSNNPAWVLYFLIKSTEYGLARYYSNVSVILQEFYNAGKWCDEQVPGAVVGQTQPRFTFNELIDSQKLGIELLYFIAGSFNSIIYDSNNGIIRLKTDQMGVAKQLFTPETVEDGKFNYSFSDISTRYNDITVQFVNPDLNWELDERGTSIDASEWIEANGRVPHSFVAVGCTNTHEAIRRANDRLLTANTEVTSVSFQTSRFGLLTELYDTILIADPVSGWSTGGRIKSYDEAEGVIHFRDPIYVANLQVFSIKIQTYSGITQVQFVPPGTPGLIYSGTLAGAPGYDVENTPPRAQFTIESATNNIGFAKPFRVVSIAEIDGNVDHYQITAIEINPDKYPDSANGTVSEPIQYSYVQPQEPKLPSSILIENTPPITLTGGTLGYRIRVSWNRPPNAFTDHYEIDFSEENSGTTKTQIAFGEEVYLEPVKDNTFYSIKFFAVSPKGTRSRFALENNAFYVTTKEVVLEDMSTDVGDFLIVQTPTGWRAGWSQPTAPFKDFAGVMLKYTYTIPRPPWSLLDTFGLSKPEENFKDLGWFEAGPLRIFAKFTNTSGNESGNPVFADLTISNPAAPTAVVTPLGASNQVVLTDPTTSQPVKVIEVKLGEVGQDWSNATLDYFTLSGLTFSVVSRENVETLMLVRATDVANNISSVSSFTLPQATVEAGVNSSSASMYQWSTSDPGSPNGTSTYTWATGVNSAYTGNDNWSLTIPNNPGIPLSKLWVVSKVLVEDFGVATSNVDYSGVPRIAQTVNGANGDTGVSGLQGATPTLFRWDVSNPPAPVGSATYTWATGSFGSAPTNWSLTAGNPPAAGFTLYVWTVKLLETAGIATTGFNWNQGTVDTRGAAGANGVSAKSLSLAATSQVFQVNNAGVSNPASITFTATSQNLVGSPTFIATGGTLSGSGDTRTLAFTDASSDRVTVQVSQDGLIDLISVVKVRDGTDTYSVLLSNEVHTIPAGPTGSATSYAGAETYITILKGSVDDTPNWSITYGDNNLVSVRSATQGGSANAAGRWWRVTYQDVDVGTINLTLSKSGVSTLYATYTSTLSRKGTTGDTGLKGDKGDKGDTGDQGPGGGSGAQGNSYRSAYAVVSGQSLNPSPSPYITGGGSGVFPPNNTWGGSEVWQATVPSYSAGQSIQQIDGIYNPITGETVWSAPYLSALKVGSLSAITISTGNLSVTGDIHMSSGGSFSSGAYGGAFSWPSSGTGFHLGESGLLMGNPNTGSYFRADTSGYVEAPGFVISGGNATFSGSLNAATGHFRGALSGGDYGSSYSWPGGGGIGFHLSDQGLLLGNPNIGKFFQVTADGNVYAPGFSIVNGSASFSGTITGSFYQTAASGKRITINDSGSNDLRVYSDLPGSTTLVARIGEYYYDSIYGYSFLTAGYAGAPYNGVMGVTGTGAGGNFIATGSGVGVVGDSDTGLAARFRSRASPQGTISFVQQGLMTSPLPETPNAGIGGGGAFTYVMTMGIVAGGMGVNYSRVGGGVIGTLLDTSKITVTTNPATPTGGNDGDMVIVY